MAKCVALMPDQGSGDNAWLKQWIGPMDQMNK